MTVERGVSKHAIAFICQAARVAQFLMQSIQSWGRWQQTQTNSPWKKERIVKSTERSWW